MEEKLIMNKKKKTAITAACFLLTAFAAVQMSADIRPAADSVTVIYGEKAEIPPCTAKLMSFDVTPMITVQDCSDYEKTGDYRIDYVYKVLGIPFRRVSVPVSVIDVDAPQIEMPETVYFSLVNKPDAEPVYSITDNYDSTDAIEVRRSGETVPSREGTYPMRVIAKDSSGNVSSKTFFQVKGDIGEADFEPGVFHLKDYDNSGVILDYNEATEMTEWECSQIYYIGDSNFVNMGMCNAADSSHVFARLALSPSSFDLPVYHKNEMTYYNAAYLVKEYRPNTAVVLMGLSEAGSGDPVGLADAYEKRIDELQEASPDTQFIISAVLPVIEGESEAAASQLQVNRVNYCLLKMCEKRGWNMLDAAEVYTGENGYAETRLFAEDGYHIKNEYFWKYLDQVRCSVHLK
ncbi:MAG: hypothetical protein K6D03_02505 [Solobacterium sp.]|nr:hypothetical protein [Solobacterium sp.]